MIHIATVHWKTARWIAPQQAYLRKHLHSDFRVYAWRNDIPKPPIESFHYVCSEPVESHAAKLNLLADVIQASAENESDTLLFLDGDAFPIGDIETLLDEGLPEQRLVAIQRLENNGDRQPHPCFCATTIGFWRQIGGDWKPGYAWKDKQGEEVTDVGGNLLGKLTQREVNWMPLLRSNRVNLHPLFFGVYGNVIYHHGAGFRSGECRIDIANTQLDLRQTVLSKILPAYGRRLRHRAGRKRAAHNDQLGEQIYETIRNDPRFFAQFL